MQQLKHCRYSEQSAARAAVSECARWTPIRRHTKNSWVAVTEAAAHGSSTVTTSAPTVPCFCKKGRQTTAFSVPFAIRRRHLRRHVRRLEQRALCRWASLLGWQACLCQASAGHLAPRAGVARHSVEDDASSEESQGAVQRMRRHHAGCLTVVLWKAGVAASDAIAGPSLAASRSRMQ